MVDLTTQYLGMKLRSPLVVSANPLTEKVENLQKMEDAGASAVVLYSLFEEQIRHEREQMYHYMLYGSDSHAEASTYFPEPVEYHTGPVEYLKLIENAKKTVKVPIIASLNGASVGGWVRFAKRMEDAGADALELNIYSIPSDIYTPSHEIEHMYLDIVRGVRRAINIPIAVKLSPFFTNMGYMAHQFEHAGANALVLFNRFYQPDIDLETLEVRPNVLLSTPQALRLPLRWIAMLHGRVNIDLAGTSGVHSAEDVIKMLLVGANVTMMASAILKNGIDHLRGVEAGLVDWMTHHEYVSVQQMRGSMSQMNAEDPSAFERVQYMRALTTFTPAV